MSYEVIWREDNTHLPKIEKRIEIAASDEKTAADAIINANKKIKAIVLSVKEIH